MHLQVAADRDPAAAPLHLRTPHLTPDDWAQGPAVLAIQTLVRPDRPVYRDAVARARLSVESPRSRNRNRPSFRLAESEVQTDR
jgi:hypothetical protein